MYWIYFPGAIGLEMEIYGMFIAVEYAIGRPPEYIAFKTAADFADSEKKDAAQKLASAISAERSSPSSGNMTRLRLRKPEPSATLERERITRLRVTVMGWTAPRRHQVCQDGCCHKPI